EISARGSRIFPSIVFVEYRCVSGAAAGHRGSPGGARASEEKARTRAGGRAREGGRSPSRAPRSGARHGTRGGTRRRAGGGTRRVPGGGLGSVAAAQARREGVLAIARKIAGRSRDAEDPLRGPLPGRVGQRRRRALVRARHRPGGVLSFSESRR